MSEFITFDFDTMGTVAIITMASNNDWRLKTLCEQVEDICSHFDGRFSTYREDSTLSMLRREGPEMSSWPQDFQDLITAGENFEAATGGYFSLRAPDGTWDPTGLVKARAIDAVSIFLEAQGIKRFSVNIGGDIALGPEMSRSDLSRIAVGRPLSITAGAQTPAIVVELANSPFRALATSGTTERGDHIWRSPNTGDMPLQASVIARDIITADTWATALVSGGGDALERFVASGIGEAIVFNHSDQMVITPGIASLISQPDETAASLPKAS